ncbi:MAG: pyrroline-5-carboxylate reductase [Armatimonadetes bacterium]|nr:pyrroline-5-carboxylate reductase [Armatimonadota bacterium]MDW8122739.1 pyrroline-5-carboxylate reductase [Armatimonadota bacterium]
MKEVLKDRILAIIGSGAMGSALIRGLLNSGAMSPNQIIATDIDPKRLEEAQKLGCQVTSDNRLAARQSHILLLAVKPQVMDEVLTELVPAVNPTQHLVISIAAGIPIAKIEKHLPEGTPIVRVMPNTPAQVLAGASALAPNRFVTREQREIAKAIFAASGIALEVEERYLDAVTAVSGSGPAYVCLFIEALADGGVRAGLPRTIALTLAAQTVLGTARMVLETGAHPGVLKDQVTSPAGTTIAALSVLESRAFRGAVIDAVFAAFQRARELSQG